MYKRVYQWANVQPFAKYYVIVKPFKANKILFGDPIHLRFGSIACILVYGVTKSLQSIRYYYYIYMCAMWANYIHQWFQGGCPDTLDSPPPPPPPPPPVSASGQACLRQALSISPLRYIPDTTIRAMSSSHHASSVVRLARLRWLGHVWRMEDSRIPKMILFSELTRGKLPQHRPFLEGLCTS